jgi:DNA damage-binding protein 1
VHRSDAHILVSTLQHSLLFRLNDDSTITHLDPSSTGFITNAPTLALSNIPRRLPKSRGQYTSTYVNSTLVVQVTTTAVILVEDEMGLGMYTRVGQQWTPESMTTKDQRWRDREIVTASVNQSQIVLGLSGSRLALLNINDRDEIQLLASVVDALCCTA